MRYINTMVIFCLHFTVIPKVASCSCKFYYNLVLCLAYVDLHVVVFFFNQEGSPSILHDHEDRALLLSWPDHEGNTLFQ